MNIDKVGQYDNVLKDLENQGKRLNKEQEQQNFLLEIQTIKRNIYDKRINERKEKFKEAIPLIKEQIRRKAEIETSMPITLAFVQEHQASSNVLFRDELISILEEEFPNFKIIRSDFDDSVICFINWNHI